jgi:hypothetical protein
MKILRSKPKGRLILKRPPASALIDKRYGLSSASAATASPVSAVGKAGSAGLGDAVSVAIATVKFGVVSEAPTANCALTAYATNESVATVVRGLNFEKSVFDITGNALFLMRSQINSPLIMF